LVVGIVVVGIKVCIAVVDIVGVGNKVGIVGVNIVGTFLSVLLFIGVRIAPVGINGQLEFWLIGLYYSFFRFLKIKKKIQFNFYAGLPIR
jgi:hypothetical protein